MHVMSMVYLAKYHVCRHVWCVILIAACVLLGSGAHWWGRAASLTGLAGIGVVAIAGSLWADIRHELLPNALTAILASVVAAASMVLNVAGAATTGALAACIPLLIVHLVVPAAIGFGDVKFGLPLGAFAGMFAAHPVRAGLLTIAIASAGFVVFGVFARQRSGPFGPALAAGSVCVFAGAVCGNV